MMLGTRRLWREQEIQSVSGAGLGDRQEDPLHREPEPLLSSALSEEEPRPPAGLRLQGCPQEGCGGGKGLLKGSWLGSPTQGQPHMRPQGHLQCQQE
jgi:hypothetical protein